MSELGKREESIEKPPSVLSHDDNKEYFAK